MDQVKTKYKVGDEVWFPYARSKHINKKTFLLHQNMPEKQKITRISLNYENGQLKVQYAGKHEIFCSDPTVFDSEKEALTFCNERNAQIVADQIKSTKECIKDYQKQLKMLLRKRNPGINRN